MNRQFFSPNILKNQIVLLLSSNKSTILTLILLGVLADIIITPGSSDFRIFSILAVYAFSIRFYKLNSSISFIYSLIFLSAMFVSFLVNKTSDITEKSAVWVILFFFIGIAHQWRELYGVAPNKQKGERVTV